MTLLSALLLISTGPQVPMSLDLGVVRAPVVIGAIAKKTGLQLHCEPIFADEVLFVDAADVPATKLMEYIAGVCHAEWVPQSDGLWLKRVKVEEDRKAEASRRENQMRAAIDDAFAGATDAVWTASTIPARVAEMKGFVNAAPRNWVPTPKSQRDWSRFKLGTPMGKLFRATVNSMNLHSLLDFPVSDTVCFSTNPTPMQGTLPGAASRALSTYLAEHSALVGTMPASDQFGTLSFAIPEALLSVYRRNVLEPALLYAAVSRSSPSTISFSLKVIDADGTTVQRFFMSFEAAPPPSEGELPGEPDWTAQRLDAGESALRAVASGGDPSLPLSGVPGADDPVNAEPLGILMNSSMRQLAAKVHRPVVARIPDSMTLPFMGCLKANRTLGGLVRALRCCVKVETRPDGVLFSPTESDGAYDERARRSAFHALFVAEKSGAPTLDDAAGYLARQNPGARFTGLEQVVLCWNRCRSWSYPSLAALDNPGYPALRDEVTLYCSLSASARAALAAGRAVRVQDLNPGQSALLEHLVYRAGVYIRPKDGSGRGPALDIDHEPTFLLRDGISPNSELKISVDRRRSILLLSKDGTAKTAQVADVAMSVIARQEGLKAVGIGTDAIDPEVASAVPLTMFDIGVSLTTPEGPIADFSLTDFHREGARARNWHELPDAWSKMVDMDKLRTAMKSRGGTNSVPPPASDWALRTKG
ncbi:MAG: hypothetical protein ACHQ50_03540 [Fimbriimonadales bacterium]